MGIDQVGEKFIGCAAYAGWPKAKAEDAAALVQELEDLDDIRTLTGLLSR